MGCSGGRDVAAAHPKVAPMSFPIHDHHLVDHSDVMQLAALFDRLELQREIHKGGYGAPTSTEGYSAQNYILNFGQLPGAGHLTLEPSKLLNRKTDQGDDTGSVHALFCAAMIASLEAAGLPLVNPGIKPLMGARTRPHTDKFRGPHPNAVLFLDPGASLVLRTDVQFHTSVVEYRGRFYIPQAFLPDGDSPSGNRIHMISQAAMAAGAGLPALVMDLFDANVLDELTPVGELEIIVAGIDDDLQKLLISSHGSPYSLRPADFEEMVEQARRHPLQLTGPTYQRLQSVGRWEAFEGWRFMHYFEGDPRVRRVYLMNRALAARE
eukprot:CAMPEP_0172768868 /NCGR_PEP_ID=MMETSP1074-20121228/185536_1 /TAXON_ID=2916 /ORGANISM="Ceratium fusus, Strain PA161109" /LENGTH=322 /DNA_ID=CAMNT_0013604335 /DNA_START=38 /DNA_END=1003 /DNA_ORIENTATION=-